MSSLSLPLLVAIYLVAAVAVWVAGIRLSNATDVLASRLGLGEALGGLILLAIATNLPEIAITASAALRHDWGSRSATSSAASPSRPWCWWRSTPLGSAAGAR